jgi:hypothetical protein
MGCEKEAKHQRVSSAKQRVPLLGFKRMSCGEGAGATTMASSNARITQNEVSNKFIHSKVKIKDFLSNDMNETDKENSKMNIITNDLNSENNQRLNSGRITETVSP